MFCNITIFVGIIVRVLISFRQKSRIIPTLTLCRSRKPLDSRVLVKEFSCGCVSKPVEDICVGQDATRFDFCWFLTSLNCHIQNEPIWKTYFFRLHKWKIIYLLFSQRINLSTIDCKKTLYQFVFPFSKIISLRYCWGIENSISGISCTCYKNILSCVRWV